MPPVLDRGLEEDIAVILLDSMEELGYTPEEFIPGLILAAKMLAAEHREGEQVLDETFNLLDERREEEDVEEIE